MTDKGKFEGHTPGPWRLSGPDDFGDFAIQPPDAVLAIAAAVNGEIHRMGGRQSEQSANARLIAAAPDLLSTNEKLTAENARLREALKRCVAVLGGEAMSKSELIAALETARAALTQSQE